MARNLVNLEGVGKAYGTRHLLDDVTLGVGEGDRTGVVGRNGDGKSTLLRLLTRREPPDAGRVTHAGGLRVAEVGQRDDLDPAATVRSLVVGDGPAHEWAADPRARDVLTGLFGDRADLDAMLDRVVGPLSGGERRRVALARALVGEHDLLVLDEPTNHLDVEGIDWLARHLAARREALVVVTHDRWFLDEVCDRTWEVQGGAVHAYDGGYSAYVLARAERDRMQQATDARRANLVRKELAWLRRGPPARTSKPRFRIDAANALIAEEPPPRDGVELVKFASARLGRTVYDVLDATVEVGGTVLLEHLTWLVGPGDRIGIAGVNGSGKTSLMRLLVGDLAPTAGKVVRGVTVRPAYLSQDVVELPPALRVLEAVEMVRREVDLGKGRVDHGHPDVRAVRLRRQRAVDAGRRALRRRAAAAAAAAAADGRAERAAARRADQRPRHRHADRAGGPARRLGRAPCSSSRTTATSSSGSATGPWRCSATGGCVTCRAAWTSTSRGAGRVPRLADRPAAGRAGGGGGVQRRRPTRRRPGPPARSWPGWSASWTRCATARPGCTTRWRPRRPTTSGCSRWTRTCGRWYAERSTLEERWLELAETAEP